MLYQSLYSRLKTQHESIPELLSGIDPARLRLNPSPGKWSVKDNIAHLAKYQPVFLERIDTILKQDSPHFERYLAESDPDFESWRTLDIESLLFKLGSDRTDIFNLITQLTASQLKRTGRHPRFGTLNIPEWTEFFLLHEAHHIFTIFQLAKS